MFLLDRYMDPKWSLNLDYPQQATLTFNGKTQRFIKVSSRTPVVYSSKVKQEATPASRRLGGPDLSAPNSHSITNLHVSSSQLFISARFVGADHLFQNIEQFFKIRILIWWNVLFLEEVFKQPFSREGLFTVHSSFFATR